MLVNLPHFIPDGNGFPALSEDGKTLTTSPELADAVGWVYEQFKTATH